MFVAFLIHHMDQVILVAFVSVPLKLFDGLQDKSTSHVFCDFELPSGKYRVRVSAANIVGSGPYSEAICIPDVPSEPTNLLVALTKTNSLDLQWDPPDHDGGRPVTSYRLEVASCAPALFVIELPSISPNHVPGN